MSRLIIKTLAALVLAAATASTAAATGIQTIDCQVDYATAAERTICSSQRLQILDAKITEIYADIMLDRRISHMVKSNLRDSQYAFLARRDACGADRDCLAGVMNQRLTRIHAYF